MAAFTGPTAVSFVERSKLTYSVPFSEAPFQFLMYTNSRDKVSVAVSMQIGLLIALLVPVIITTMVPQKPCNKFHLLGMQI